MTETQRIEYNTLVELTKQLDSKIAEFNEAINDNIDTSPNSSINTFHFLIGSKYSLMDFKDTINIKLAEYRKTIFQTKKLQENEQA